jgi:hypothetical protein
LKQDDHKHSNSRRFKPFYKHLSIVGIVVVILVGISAYAELEIGKSDIKENSFRKEPFVMRVHSDLTIMVDNKSITVPSQIGIDKPLWKYHALDKYGAPGMPMQGMVMPAMAPIYTTDNSGLINVGSVVDRNYTLGEFFQIWGLDLSGKTVKAMVDEKQVPDFKNIVLRDKQKIVLHVKP